MQLSVIIVNYNVKYFLEHCLLSVINACREIESEILVVDNNSSDGSREYLAPKFPEVKFYWQSENTGFAKANNSVLSQTKGEHIVFLNPDTLVPDDCFTRCLSFFKSHNDCGALGVRMIDGSGKFLKESKRSLPTPASGFYKMTGLEKAFPESAFFSKYYAGKIPEKENNKVKVLSGAFMMLSREAVEVTHGFDKDFFMYGEDIDLSYRVLKSGFQNYYAGEITIIHFKGESTQKNSEAYLKNFYGAISLFINKHYSKKIVRHALMSFAVAAGKMIAGLKRRKILIKAQTKRENNIAALVVGNKLQHEKVVSLLNHTSYKVQPTPIGTAEFDLKTLPKYIKDKGISALIFCEDEQCTYGNIINLLPEIPACCRAFFYSDNAESIIGSNNKNETGIFIAKR